jgi:hypothetical protein
VQAKQSHRLGQTWTCLLLTTLLFTACAQEDKWVAGRPPVFPTSGQVTYNGRPLAEAFVTFSPESGTHGASGMTDADGKYALTTFSQGDGAPIGNYTVTITKAEPKVTPNPADPVNLPPLKVEQRHLIPKKYSSPSTSGLKAAVTDGGENAFAFELTDAGT